MAQPIFTLLTDFGTQDSYVAQMKGVLLSCCPNCTLVDVTHEVPPQDVRLAARILAETVPRFPEKTTHLVVVDPGVGTNRNILAVELAEQYLVLPDNGLLTELLRQHSPRRIHRVVHEHLWNTAISPTFHGRDIIAPVAAYLASGGDWKEVGPTTDQVVRFEFTQEAKLISQGQWLCGVQAVDRFGNMMLVSSPELHAALTVGTVVELSWEAMHSRTVRVVQTYGDASPGELILLRDSQNRLELAQVNGSAAAELGLTPHGSVKISLVSSPRLSN